MRDLDVNSVCRIVIALDILVLDEEGALAEWASVGRVRMRKDEEGVGTQFMESMHSL